MGLFDTILVPHRCRTCGEEQPDYQTKALDRALDEYRLGDVIKIPNIDITVGSFEIHDFCSKCHTWIEGKAYVRNGLLIKIVEYDAEGKEVLIAEYTPGKTK